MAKRFNSKLYTKEKLGWVKNNLRYMTDPNGYLYADRTYPTKITEDDLPEWYVFGRYYKCFGYLSAKGITDMVYVPNRFTNHFLKDDDLLIAYGGTIQENPDASEEAFWKRFSSYDMVVDGSDILYMLQGAKLYSGIDITPFYRQLDAKAEWLRETFPHEFGDFEWNAADFFRKLDKEALL